MSFSSFVIFLSSFLLLSISDIGQCDRIDDSKEVEDPRWHPGDSFVTISPKCSYNPTAFRDIGTSVLKAIDFYEKNVNKLVLDAAIGTRMIEAQISVALRNHPRLPFEFQIFLRKLRRRTSILSERIISQIQKRTDISSKEKEDTIPWVKNASVWEMPQVWKSPDLFKNLDLSQIKLDIRDDSILEKNSDQCIGQIMAGCQTPTSKCAELFLKEPKSLYSLTHQAIYMLLAFEKGCFHQQGYLRNFSNGDWEKYLVSLCSKVWGEANMIEKLGFPWDYRDLFTEQIGICGLAGHPNFLEKIEWLEKIQSWQTKGSTGCWPEPSPFLNGFGSGKRRQLKKVQKNQQKRQKLLQRNKRNDAQISTGSESCSVHFTSVSLTASAVHLRYFIDTCLSTY